MLNAFMYSPIILTRRLITVLQSQDASPNIVYGEAEEPKSEHYHIYHISYIIIYHISYHIISLYILLVSSPPLLLVPMFCASHLSGFISLLNSPLFCFHITYTSPFLSPSPAPYHPLPPLSGSLFIHFVYGGVYMCEGQRAILEPVLAFYLCVGSRNHT